MLTAPHIPSLGKKGGRRGFLKGSLLYCFKLCTNRHMLPLCPEHTCWDICKAQLLCAKAQGTSKAPDTLYLLHTDCMCQLLKKIPIFSKELAKFTKSFQTLQAFAVTLSILFEVDLSLRYTTLGQNEKTLPILCQAFTKDRRLFFHCVQCQVNVN